MTEEIKEILHLLKRCDNTYLKIENSNGEKEYEYHQVNDLRLDGYHSQLLLDYITNLQQENEFLKLNNPEMNIEHFRIIKENKRKIDNLRKQNKELNRMCELYSKSLYNAELTDYKSRCEKAIEYIENNKKETSSHFNGKEYVYRNFTLYCEPNDLLNILNGSDEK